MEEIEYKPVQTVRNRPYCVCMKKCLLILGVMLLLGSFVIGLMHAIWRNTGHVGYHLKWNTTFDQNSTSSAAEGHRFNHSAIKFFKRHKKFMPIQNFSHSTEVQDLNKKIADEAVLYQVQLATLTKMLTDVPGLYPCLDTDFLLRFLWLHDYNPDRAKKQIVDYYQLKADYPEVFQSIPITTIKEMYEDGVVSFLPDLDKDGSLLLLADLFKWNDDKHGLDEVYAAAFAAIDWATSIPNAQLNGIKTMSNSGGLTWSKLWQFRPRHITLGVNMYEEYLPANHKHIHILNSNTMFDILFSWCKPMLTKSVQDKIVINNDQYEQLLNDVDPILVPTMYGGNNQGPFGGQNFLDAFMEDVDIMKYYDQFGFKVDN